MPDAGFGTVHQNAALSNVLVTYRNADMVLREKVFKPVKVNFKADDYYIYDQGATFRREARAVGARGKVPRVGFTYTTGSYNCEYYELAYEIPEKLRRNMDPAIAADINGAKKAMDGLLLDQEIRIATALATTANWTTTVAIAAGSEWDSGGGGDPIGVLNTGIKTIRATIGIPANIIVITWLVENCLRHHPLILDRIDKQSTPESPAVGTARALASILGVDEVVVVGGMYDSADEGQSVSLTNILTDTTWIGYVNREASLFNPSAGYLFEFENPYAKTWTENDPEQVVYKAGACYTTEVCMAGAGYTITNCLSAI